MSASYCIGLYRLSRNPFNVVPVDSLLYQHSPNNILAIRRNNGSVSLGATALSEDVWRDAIHSKICLPKCKNAIVNSSLANHCIFY